MNYHFSDSRPISTLENKFEYISNSLKPEDWHKIIFLCGSHIEKEEALRMKENVENSSSTPFQTLKNVIFSIRVNKGIGASTEEGIVLELLFHLKKYRLLKTFQSCKHQQSEKEEYFIEPLWKYLFNLVEDLSDEELKFVAQKLDSNANCSNFVFTKELFQKFIEENNNIIEILKGLFQSHFPQRRELLNKAIEFEKNMKPCYKIDGGRKYGYAVIFNNLNFDKVPPWNCPNKTDLGMRTGTNKDRDNLENLWHEFGMDVDTHQDLTSEQLVAKIEELSKIKNYDQYQIFVCCILSHGTKDYIYASDGVEVPISLIHTQFGTYTKSLSNKPKLFFVQACQGDESNRFMSDARIDPPPRNIQQSIPTPQPNQHDEYTPMQADILIGTSTVPGYKSWRSESQGSVYIQTLVDVISERGDQEEFRELMKDINNEVSQKKINGVTCQMPSITDQFRKRLYLKRFPVTC